LSTHITNSSKEEKGSAFGNVSGGRLIAQVGNNYYLLSGSIDKIEHDIENLKSEFNVPYVTVYTLDNGSYSRALRTYDKTFTAKDLRKYDNQNTSGGNFLYITGNKNKLKFPSDTVTTSNITEKDLGYNKELPSENKPQGVALYHTGLVESNPTGLPNYLARNNISPNVVIGYNGERKVLAYPETITSNLKDELNVNDFMLGVMFQGNTNKKDLTDEQIESAVEYLTPLIYKYKIPLDKIITQKTINDLYKEYKEKNKSKFDITVNNYNKIINKLLEKVYYKPIKSEVKKSGGIINYLNLFKSV
jgi:hypothetical protein